MSNLYWDRENGIIVENASFKMVDGNERILQLIEQKFRTFKGEYHLNPLIGLDYLEEDGFFSPMLTKNEREFMAKKLILEIPEVIEILEFNLKVSEMAAKISYKLYTEYDVVEGRVMI